MLISKLDKENLIEILNVSIIGDWKSFSLPKATVDKSKILFSIVNVFVIVIDKGNLFRLFITIINEKNFYFNRP